jgi:ribose-phosphate pyrophosphokinase
MSPVVIGLPGSEPLTARLGADLTLQSAAVSVHTFPDGETSVRIHGDVRGRVCVLVCSLERPNDKAVPLYLTAATVRELGVQRILLVASYLPYMRQDAAFRAGEGVSARHVARWLSSFVDAVVTVDPHLHRIRPLAEIYSIPTRVVAAARRTSRGGCATTFRTRC